MAQQVCQVFGVDGCVIRLLGANELILLASAGIPAGTLFPTIPTTWGVTRRILSHRRPVFVADVHTRPSTAPVREHLRKDFPFTSYAGAPLLARGRVIGLMGIYWIRGAPTFSKADLSYLEVLGNSIAVAIVNDRLYHEMKGHRDRLERETCERLKAEQSHRESEARFRMVAENARAIFGIVQDDRFVYANPYFAEVSGYAVEEILSMDFAQMLDPLHRAMILDRERRRLAGEVMPHHYEFPLRTRSGEARWVDFTAAPIEYNGKPAIIGTAFDITDRKRAEAALKESEHAHLDQMRRLARDTERLLEEERASVSRHLHDGVGQSLTSLMMRLAWVEKRIRTSRPALAEEIAHAGRQAGEMIDDLRKVARSLRPVAIDQEGLIPAIHSYVKEFERLSGVKCRVKAHPADLVVKGPVATVLYRILQEAMTNVVRHAGASRCDVRLEASRREVRLSVQDDGKGATRVSLDGHRSLGILGMRERAFAVGGTVCVENGAGGGVLVTARFPLEKGPAVRRRAPARGG